MRESIRHKTKSRTKIKSSKRELIKIENLNQQIRLMVVIQ